MIEAEDPELINALIAARRAAASMVSPQLTFELKLEAMLAGYVDGERLAARTSAIAAWLERPSIRLARRIRRAFLVVR